MQLAELEQLTLKDLRDLRGRIEKAIRTAIARSRQPVKPAEAAPEQPKLDLERERAIWLARKQTQSAVDVVD
jgi:hypothetical protein